jgi:hypothetical protein
MVAYAKQCNCDDGTDGSGGSSSSDGSSGSSSSDGSSGSSSSDGSSGSGGSSPGSGGDAGGAVQWPTPWDGWEGLYCAQYSASCPQVGPLLKAVYSAALLAIALHPVLYLQCDFSRVDANYSRSYCSNTNMPITPLL